MLDLVTVIEFTKNDPVNEDRKSRGVQTDGETDSLHVFFILQQHQKILAVCLDPVCLCLSRVTHSVLYFNQCVQFNKALQLKSIWSHLL